MHSKRHNERVANAIAKRWQSDGIVMGIGIVMSSNSTLHGIATYSTRAIDDDAMLEATP